MSRRPGLALFLVATLAGCSGSGASPAPTALVAPAASVALAEATITPYGYAPHATPRCPTDTLGTEDPTGFVPGRANIFGAGHAVAPQPAGDGGGYLPPVWPLPAGTSRIVTFPEVIGCVNPTSDVGSGGKWNGPDGDHVGRTDVTSYGGISGIVYQHNEMFLVGVFLSDSEPTGDGPGRLEFKDGQVFDLLEPELGQTFLIGDGVGHRYRAPAGATRLFLGFADADAFQGPPGLYYNNAGELHVTVKIVVE